MDKQRRERMAPSPEPECTEQSEVNVMIQLLFHKATMYSKTPDEADNPRQD